VSSRVPPPADGADTVRDSPGTVLVKRWEHNPRCVAHARHELRQELGTWGIGELTDTAELVLSELLTNALRHARIPRGRLIETRYERVGRGVRIEVHDANETWPAVQKPSVDEESGRGLALVDALTGARWGVSEREGVGKLIWAFVTGDQEAAAAEQPGGAG
jgi:serine/threonine-protein kinase RsbW